MEPLDRITLYRFRVRTADGREAVSRTVAVRKRQMIGARLADDGAQQALEADAQPDRMLANPRWSSEKFEHGAHATLQVDAAGLDGRTVRFVIERRDGERWVAHDTLSAKVAAGVAEAALDLAHPAPDDPDGAPADFRFSCELA